VAAVVAADRAWDWEKTKLENIKSYSCAEIYFESATVEEDCCVRGLICRTVVAAARCSCTPAAERGLLGHDING